MKLDPRKFLFSSDFPTDKIIYMREAEAKTDKYGQWNIRLDDAPKVRHFAQGVWSIDNFKTSIPLGMEKEGSYMSSVGGRPGRIYAGGDCETKEGTVVKIRVWAFVSEADTAGVDFTPTANKSVVSLSFDTDYKYPALVAEGYLRAGESFKHNLGYKPFCSVWEKNLHYEEEDSFSPLAFDDFEDTLVNITDAEIVMGNSEWDKNWLIYYRIYA